jgi:hypothetical protein
MDVVLSLRFQEGPLPVSEVDFHERLELLMESEDPDHVSGFFNFLKAFVSKDATSLDPSAVLAPEAETRQFVGEVVLRLGEFLHACIGCGAFKEELTHHHILQMFCKEDELYSHEKKDSEVKETSKFFSEAHEGLNFSFLKKYLICGHEANSYDAVFVFKER